MSDPVAVWPCFKIYKEASLHHSSRILQTSRVSTRWTPPRLLECGLCRDNCQSPHCIWIHWSLTSGEWRLWYGIVWGRDYSWLSSVNYEFIEVLCVTCDAVLHS
jgi:hypothetical protein